MLRIRLTPSSPEAAYLWPFALLEEGGVRSLSVTHSVKLSYRGLESDRYFIRFPNVGVEAETVADVCQRLHMPSLAEQWVMTGAGGWTQAGSVGAARSGSGIMYRAYFRTGVETPGEVYGWGVEWSRSGEPGHARRRYTLLHAQTAQEARPIVTSAIHPSASRTDDEVFEAWMEVLSSAPGAVQFLEVRDPVSGRLSFDAAPAFDEALKFEGAAECFERWLGAFGIPAAEWNQIAGRAAGMGIQNIALGRDASNRLFATVYFGPYDRPQSGRNTGSGLVPSAVTIGEPVFTVGILGALIAPDQWERWLESPVPEFRAAAETRNLQLLCDALRLYPAEAVGVSWTLDVDGASIYLLEPDNAFSADVYAMLVDFFSEELARQSGAPGIERIAVAGRIGGTRLLRADLEVTVLRPIPREMSSWSTSALVQSLAQPEPPGLRDFLAALYARQKNAGTQARDRALNFISTQPGAYAGAFTVAAATGRAWDSISVSPHLLRARGRDWFDVSISFSPIRDPGLSQMQAVMTVDVREPMPFFSGPLRLLEAA